MRPLRRPTTTTIHYHGRESFLSRHAVMLSINGVRWLYYLTAQQCDTIEYLAKHVSAGKALAFAKKHADKAECLDEPSRVAATLLRNRGGIASRNKRLKVTLPNV